MRKSILFCLVLLVIFVYQIPAQTPQYYNINDGNVSNNFPFNINGGKAVNTLFLPGDFDHPTVLPQGMQITKIYFRMSLAGTRSYTNFHILLAQSNSTLLTRGEFYAGPYDTVYFKSSVSLTANMNEYMSFTLDHPFVYDVNKSLILLIGQCGSTGSGIAIYNKDLSQLGVRRVWSIGGCPFAVNPIVGDSSVVNLGLDVEPVLSVNTQNEIINEYTLSQNNPNPFNPVTEITYSIPKQGFVTLKVYDLLGKEVATLVNSVKKSGKYSVTFDGGNLPSGMYIYKLVSNDIAISKKMMLVK